MRLFTAYLLLIHIVLAVGVYRKVVQYTSPRDVPPREQYIKARRDLLKIADANKPKNAVVFLGDSLTESLATSNIPNAVNYGIGYSTTHDLNERIHDYDYSDVKAVVLMIGTNDAAGNVEPEPVDLPDVPVYWYAAPLQHFPNAKDFNTTFKQECSEHPQCTFIELPFNGHFISDGVHLNPDGLRIWLDSLNSELK